MKRLRLYILVCLILIIIVSGSFLYINTKTLLPMFLDKITVYSIYGAQNKLTHSPDNSAELIELITNAYNDGTTVQDTRSGQYTINIRTNYFIDKKMSLLLNPDNMTGTIWMYGVFGKTQAIKEDDVKKLLSYELFFNELIKTRFVMPKVSISTNNNQIDTQDRIVEWNYPYPSGNKVYKVTNDKDRESTPQVISSSPGDVVTISTVQGTPPDGVVLIEHYNGKSTNVDLVNNTFKVPEFDGKINYKLISTWNEKQYPDSYGVIEQNFSCLVDIPPEITTSSTTVKPGDIISLFVKHLNENQNPILTTSVYPNKISFSPYKDGMIAVIPVDWWTTPGEYTMDLSISDEKGVISNDKITIDVLEDNFEKTNQQLVVSDKLKEKTSSEASNNDYKYTSEAKSNSNLTPLWEGTFILPVDGRIGTTYGRTRYINGANPYRHSGLDISGTTGTPVKAGNTGKVVLAMELIRTGNTIIIDHGMGLFSGYCHLSALNVKVGDMVKKGELIGKVGSTGFSTGPHLHWSITLNNKYVSPNLLMKSDLLNID